MENLSLSDCLLIGTGFTVAFVFTGFLFCIIELLQQKKEGEKVSFWYAIVLGLQYIFFAGLIGIVFSLIVCGITYGLYSLGIDPSDLPENPYF